MPTSNDPPRWATRIVLCLLTGIIISGTAYYCAFLTYRNSYQARSEQHQTIQLLERVRAHVDFHKENTGAWPKRLTDLEAVKQHALPLNDNGEPVDVWGRPLHYEVGEDGYRLFSYGRDGKPGGDGEDADLFAGQPEPGAPPPTLRDFATGAHALLGQIPCIGAGLVAIPILLLNARGQPGKRPSILQVLAANIVTACFAIFAALFIAALHLVPGGH